MVKKLKFKTNRMSDMITDKRKSSDVHGLLLTGYIVVYLKVIILLLT